MYSYKSLNLKNDHEPHDIKLVKRLNLRCFEIELSPSLKLIEEQGSSGCRLVLASRYSKLFFPKIMLGKTIVNICLVKDNNNLTKTNLEIIDIGELKKVKN